MTLPRTTPEAQGIPTAALNAFLDAVDARDCVHSFMLLRHRAVVAEGWWEPYRRDDPHMLFSLSKSFTSSACGFAVAEGLLSVDDFVLSFFPDEAPAEPSAYLKQMRVKHLLCMGTGHTADPIHGVRTGPVEDWTRAFLETPVEYEPGSRFMYGSGATYVVSAILQKLTGQKIVDYLRPRLFEPLGIENPVWETCPKGINTGGWGLNVKTEDILRLGLLYLQDGMWEGRQLLPDGWAAEATRCHIDNSPGRAGDWATGYGYQFWRSRYNSYRGDGAFGQFCLVLPEQDAVVAMTSGTGDLQGVLDLVWEHLLPAMGPAPLPADPASDALAERLATQQMHAPEGAVTSPVAAQVTGRTYRLEDNPLSWASLRFDFAEGTVTLVEDGREQQIAVGAPGAWARTEIPPVTRTLSVTSDSALGASGAWEGETYVLRVYLVNTPYCRTLRCAFSGDEVTLDVTQNVTFGAMAAAATVRGRVGG